MTQTATQVSGPTAHEQYFCTDHLTRDLRGRAVRSGAVTVAAQSLKFVLQAGSMVALARLLTPEHFGVVAMVTAITGFATRFKDMGLSMATVQKPEITHEQVSTLFWINVGLSVIVMLILTAMAPAISWFYGKPELLVISLVLAVGVIFEGFGVQHQALLQRQMRFKSIAVRDLGGMAAGTMTAVIMAALGAGYWSLVAMSVVTSAVSTIALWLGCPWRPGPPVWSSGVRSMLAFGGNLSFAGLVGYIGQNTDKILLGYLYGADALGCYTRAYYLMLFPLSRVLPPIMSVANPVFSRLAPEPKRYRQAMLSLVAKVAFLSTFVAAISVVSCDWLVQLLLGPGWDQSVKFFAVLSAFAFVESIAAVAGATLTTLGHADRLLQWKVISAIITLFGLAAGLPWGILGVAAAYAATGVLIRVPLLLWFTSRYSPIGMLDWIRAILPYLFSSVLLCAMLTGLRAHIGPVRAPVGLIVMGLAGSSIYLGLVCTFRSGRAMLHETLHAVGALLRHQYSAVFVK